MLLLSCDTAYKAQGRSVVLHVVESTDRTMMSETLGTSVDYWLVTAK